MFRILLLLSCVGLSFSSLAQQNNNTSTAGLSEKIDRYMEQIQRIRAIIIRSYRNALKD